MTPISKTGTLVARNFEKAAITVAAPFAIDVRTGALAGATSRSRKLIRDLDGLFVDEAAFRARVVHSGDELVYEVYEAKRSEASGDLIFGTSVLQPGLVGNELYMTRGHLHTLTDRSEIYYCIGGRGILLMESVDGESHVAALEAGVVAYVPPRYIHRCVNLGEELLVTLFCYPADAGHDYEIVKNAHGMRHLVVRADGEAQGWALARNPRYISRG